jgi:hypothetical protein
VKFTLTIEMGNDSMQSRSDVREALVALPPWPETKKESRT